MRRTIINLLIWLAGALLFAALMAPHLRAEERKPLGMKWVHASVAAQLLGNAADCASSWKQRELNPWLQEPGGVYRGDFYRAGLSKKVGISIGVTALSYFVAKKYPKLRKYVVISNVSLGATWGGVAMRNVIVNPYYRGIQ